MFSDILVHGLLGFGLASHHSTALPNVGAAICDWACRIDVWSEHLPRLDLICEGINRRVTPHVSHAGDPVRDEQQPQRAVLTFVIVGCGKRGNGARGWLRR